MNQPWREYAGLSLEESQGLGWQAAIHPEDLQSLMERWRELSISGRPGDIELRMRRNDGSFRWFLVRFEPFRDEAGKIVMWYGVSTDIENLKRAEQKLREDERELRRITDAITTLKSIAIGLLMTSLLCPISFAQSKAISFHVAPVASKFNVFHAHYACQPEQLSWKIDIRKPVRWSQEVAVEVVGLDADQRHLVLVICDGKPLEAFRFRFSEFKDKNLCLYFDSWEGAQVMEEKRASGYTCK